MASEQQERIHNPEFDYSSQVSSLYFQTPSSSDNQVLQTPGSTCSQLIKAGNDREKIKWLKKFANVQDDGTVQVKVQEEDALPQSLDFGNGVINRVSTNEVSVDASESQDIPPLQILVLIVGTRGDVQPFVAIGKRLQVRRIRLSLNCKRETNDNLVEIRFVLEIPHFCYFY